MTIGEKIRKTRKAAKKTQKDLAELTGLSVNTICRYETGERVPTIDIIAKIAAALSMSVPDLLSEVNVLSFDIDAKEQIEKTMEMMKDPLTVRLYREQMLQSFDMLNSLGKKTAMKRVQELTEIDRYTKAEPEEAKNAGEN